PGRWTASRWVRTGGRRCGGPAAKVLRGSRSPTATDALPRSASASLLERLQKAKKEIGAGLERRNEEMLVLGMGAGADDAEPVEGGDPHRRREIAVAAAAGRYLRKLLTQRGGDALCMLVERRRLGVARERRAVDAALYVQRHIGADRLQAKDAPDHLGRGRL